MFEILNDIFLDLIFGSVMMCCLHELFFAIVFTSLR